MKSEKPTAQWEATIIGALAGITPLLVTLVQVEAESMLANASTNVLIGYSIKAIALMGLGALLVFANGETQRWKAFQIGVMAPALVIAMLNGGKQRELEIALRATQSQLDDLKKRIPVSVERNTDAVSALLSIRVDQAIWRPGFLRVAAETTQLLKGLHRDSPGAAQEVWYGITGRLPARWFVIVASLRTEEEALTYAGLLRQRGYDARVYPPFADAAYRSQYYGVLIGSNVTLDEARRLRDEAIKDGLPRETYFFTYEPSQTRSECDPSFSLSDTRKDIVAKLECLMNENASLRRRRTSEGRGQPPCRTSFGPSDTLADVRANLACWTNENAALRNWNRND